MQERTDEDSYGDENYEPFDGNRRVGISNKPQRQGPDVRGKNLRDFRQNDVSDKKRR